MKIKTLKSFTTQDENGEMISFAYKTVYDVADEIGNQLIADGLAEEVNEGGGSGSSGFLVTMTDVSSTVKRLDKNYREITEAINNGIYPVFVHSTNDGKQLYVCHLINCSHNGGAYLVNVKEDSEYGGGSIFTFEAWSETEAMEYIDRD